MKLAEIIKNYEEQLASLGSDMVRSPIHKTRFKDLLLKKLGPQWKAFQKGRDIFLSPTALIGKALASSVEMSNVDTYEDGAI
jgi:hypothetical protein